MPSLLSSLFPPAPTFTDKSLPSLLNKTYVITGAASGMGFELARMLYCKDATVYIAARSSDRATGAIKKLREIGKGSQGRLEPMVVDLADLKTLKPAVDEFLAKENRLDGLFHNAGVMTPPTGSKDTHGHDLEIATHCLAPFLLSRLFEGILQRTASISPHSSVRIVWVESLLGSSSPTPTDAMTFDGQGMPAILPKPMENYMQSKVGGAWLAASFAQRLDTNGILSVSIHPGLMKTELQRNMPFPGPQIMGLVFKPAAYGAYTQLFAGFSPTLTTKENGGYIMAWGRVAELPPNVAKGIRSQKDGGNGKAQKLWKYCEQETHSYM